MPIRPFAWPTLAILALLSTGCGRPEPAPTKKVEPAGITVTLAHAGPLTGTLAHLGKDNENGVALAIERANARQLVIDGKRVTFRLQSEDDQADPKVGTTVAQKLVDAKVAAVIGHLNSGVTLPASEIYSRAGVPMVTVSSSPLVTTRGLKGVFRTLGSDAELGPAMAAYLASALKARRVAIVDDKTAYGEGLANEVEKALKAANVAIVTRERTTDKDTDFKALLTRIKAKNPDVVFHGGMDATAGPILKQARELGIRAPFAFGDGGCSDAMPKLAGPAADGLVCAMAGLPLEATSREFRERFQARFGDVRLYAPYFYDGALAVVEAMVKANSVDPARFGPALHENSFDGATGTVAYDANGGRRDAEITIYAMQAGKLVPRSVVKGGIARAYTPPAPAAAPLQPETAKK